MFQVEKNAPTALVICDGFGYREDERGNAIAAAKMPTWDKLLANYPHMHLAASGKAVGLPDGFMGNSEVGHLCLGAGRVIRTSFCKFHDSIKDKSFFRDSLLRDRFERLKEKDGALHLMGLLSDAGVHSHIEHLYALLRLAKDVGVTRAYVHAFLDGRDVPPKSAKKYLEALTSFFNQESYGQLASMHGRFFAMDRDENWERIKKTYDVLVGNMPIQEKGTQSFEELLQESYARGVTDEFVEPVGFLSDRGDGSDGVVREGDGIVFYNFRPDRSRQLARVFLDPSFDTFETNWLTSTGKTLSFVVSTVRYDEAYKNFANDVLFESEPIKHTLLDVLAEQMKDRSVFIIAETEKYAHVTYFFRGKVDVRLPHETRVLVPSIKVKTYVDHPRMSADKITKTIVASLEAAPASFYLVNYANCDMVGHSGDFAATVQACECLDDQIKILYDEIVVKRKGTIFLVGDHGNAEEMLGAQFVSPKTSHTSNPVLFVIVSGDLEGRSLDLASNKPYGLSVVAPTIIKVLGLQVPAEMDEGVLV